MKVYKKLSMTDYFLRCMTRIAVGSPDRFETYSIPLMALMISPAEVAWSNSSR